jgi:hypothetical protein
MYRRLGGTQRLEEKSFHLFQGSNLDRPVVQPVARQYTDWATSVLKKKRPLIKE